MLSYRHAYHAGNFADVLKHMILCRILAYLVQKDKPLCFIDSHAGAGEYALTGKQALKTREFDTGIGRLWELKGLPPAVADYVGMVKAHNTGSQLLSYPGSPWFARQRLRAHDRLVLCELHSTELHLLRGFTRGDRRIKVIRGDGYQECIGLVPPHERRGLILIDPSYELKNDYSETVETLKRAWRRFETGVFALWYPVIERHRIDRMERELRRSGIRRIQLYELGVTTDTIEHGMTASGMIIVNPPWTLKEEMAAALPWLAAILGRDGNGHHRITELSGSDHSN